MEKIKLFLLSERGKDLMIIIIVILVGLASFGLGRLSNVNKGTGVKIEYPVGQVYQPANVLSALNSAPKTTSGVNSYGKNYFASNRGKKYYGVGCEAGKGIKAENRVYFNTASEAEQAGYSLSTSCR